MNRDDHPPCHLDIMNAKQAGAPQHTRNDASCRGCIAIIGIRYPKNLPDDALARNGQEKRAAELVEPVELTKDPQVIVDLLGKVYSWVKNDRVARHTRPFSKKNLVAEEAQHFVDYVLVKNVGVRNLWQSYGMDDQQGSAGLRAEVRVFVVVERAEIVEEMSAGSECDRGYFWPPRIDREQRRKYLLSISGWDIPPDFIKPLQKGKDASQFLLRRDGGSIATGALAAHIHDVRSLGNELTCLLQRPLGIKPPVTAKRVVVDIDDAHDQRAAREVDASVTGTQFHLVLGGILFQAWCLLQLP
jgi:hypothetical protein